MKRKTYWIATQDGKVVGIFPTKKKAEQFCDDNVVLTKMIWNGFYYSEKPIDYDPYCGTINLYHPMF